MPSALIIFITNVHAGPLCADTFVKLPTCLNPGMNIFAFRQGRTTNERFVSRTSLPL